jgi:hypothetical protein
MYLWYRNNLLLKSYICWAITPRSPLKVNEHSRRTHGLHFRPCRWRRHISLKRLFASCFHAGLFLGLFFNPGDRGDMFLWNIGRLSMGVISQKIELFIITAVRTSNPTQFTFTCHPYVFFFNLCGGTLDTAATTGLLCHPRMIGDGDRGEIGGMKICRGNRSTRRKPSPAPLCAPQIPHDYTWVWTKAAAVGNPYVLRGPYWIVN